MKALVTYRSYDRADFAAMAVVVEGETLVDPGRCVTVEATDGRHIIPWHQLVEVFEERGDE
ncbi:hypothetical protein [Williamsia deligens]|uniref:Uncharacterized protein n=1 Tax=Williamsia deligens TaxID=321325 RepID=A0ABW3GDD1_9NOCA